MIKDTRKNIAMSLVNSESDFFLKKPFKDQLVKFVLSAELTNAQTKYLMALMNKANSDGFDDGYETGYDDGYVCAHSVHS